MQRMLQELTKCIPPRNLPREFGGTYEVPDPSRQVDELAEEEEVDLAKAGETKEACRIPAPHGSSPVPASREGLVP